MALEGFQVACPLAARAGSASGARATLTTTGITVKALAGRTAAASGARGSLAATRPYLARARAASGARGDLSVFGAAPPPGVFATFRLLVAAVLADLDDDWEVHAAPVDAVTPPAFMLEWGDPWAEPSTACFDLAYLDVVCIAARVDPDLETLELMVAAAIGACYRAGIPHGLTSPPRPFEIAGVTYLAARIRVTNTVNVGA